MKDNLKVYKVLSYIGILWIVGLLVPEKDNKSVKFHVGQGMLVTILWVVISVINDIFVAQMFFVNNFSYWNFGENIVTTMLGGTLMWMLSLIPIVFSILGIVNALKDEDKELPLIGKFAFYK